MENFVDQPHGIDLASFDGLLGELDQIPFLIHPLSK
jgi:hypothetical protein